LLAICAGILAPDAGGRTRLGQRNCRPHLRHAQLAVDCAAVLLVIDGILGYDLHITRALFWPHAERYPIRADEVMALVEREADLVLDDQNAFDAAQFFVRVGAEDWLEFWRGRLSTKNPEDALVRRMVEIGRLLDAWVTGDDDEIYDWNGEVTVRQPSESELGKPAYQLVGAVDSPAGRRVPIAEQAWLDAVSAQPDFTIMPQVEALLPSGLRWIPSPPVAHWTGHPSGRPVPFFFDEDHIEVEIDPATLEPLRRLASLLDADILNNHLNPV
jgi:hypothetical protein